MASKKDKVGYGIIGCGNIAPKHADAIASIPGAHLVAVSDVVYAAASRLGLKYGVDRYVDFREMLERPEIDAVCLCVPSGMRLEIGLDCIQAGKHIMCEKPIEVNIARADDLIAAAEQADVLLGCIFQSRFLRGPQLTKQAIDQGRFGQFVSCLVHIPWWREPDYYTSVSWRGTLKFDGGGALINQGIHQLDLAQWFLGPISRVFGQTRKRFHQGIEMEDLAGALLEFENGALGTVMSTTATWPGGAVRFGIYGTKGTVVLEDGKIILWEFADYAEHKDADDRVKAEIGGESGTGSAAKDPIAALKGEGHLLQLRDFTEAIQSGRQPVVDGKEARKAVALAQAIYVSAESGQPVGV
ncbi:MAG: Gfo/Idh/MocA family oxidoreductase [Patescibacteria group bacterium]|jgi:predicted dehydrogenase